MRPAAAQTGKPPVGHRLALCAGFAPRAGKGPDPGTQGPNLGPCQAGWKRPKKGSRRGVKEEQEKGTVPRNGPSPFHSVRQSRALRAFREISSQNRNGAGFGAWVPDFGAVDSISPRKHQGFYGAVPGAMNERSIFAWKYQKKRIKRSNGASSFGSCPPHWSWLTNIRPCCFP